MTETVPVDEQPQLTWLWKRLYSADGARAFCRTCETEKRFHRLRTRPAYACDRCGTQIRPTSGTAFAGSSTPLAIWFAATAQLVNADDPPSPSRLADRLGVDYQTAWRIARRVRETEDRGPAASALLRDIAAAWRSSAQSEPDPPAARDASALTRKRIGAAACRALAKRGLSRTRVVDIAREAGVSSAIVHYYFRSKDEVLLSALQWAGERLRDSLDGLLDSALDPLEQLRLVLRFSAPTDEALRDEYRLWLDFWALVRIDERYLPECESMSARWRDVILEVLERGTREGVFHPVAPLEQVCRVHVSLSESLSYRCVLGYSDAGLHEVLDFLAAVLAEQLGLPAERLRLGGDATAGDPVEAGP